MFEKKDRKNSLVKKAEKIYLAFLCRYGFKSIISECLDPVKQKC